MQWRLELQEPTKPQNCKKQKQSGNSFANLWPQETPTCTLEHKLGRLYALRDTVHNQACPAAFLRPLVSLEAM
jgi:hypothetical protein